MLESLGDNAASGNLDPAHPPFYPLNKSLAEEVDRLFSQWSFSLETPYYRGDEDDVMTEFRLNGQDSEYCPEFVPANKSFYMSALIQSNKNDLNSGCLTSNTSARSKKRTKKQILECVFCKNNGEETKYYQQHVLKDSEGRTVCPILRAYTCPICSAKGDDAHTVKYCPKNTNPEMIPTMKTLKSLRSATGQRRRKGMPYVSAF